MHVLVVNTGSTSLKLHVIGDGDEVLAAEELGPLSELSPGEELSPVLHRLPPVDAVGHRVVHGGASFTESVIIDDEVGKRLAELEHLAPLHNPAALRALSAVRAIRPHLPSVVCFDTTFHGTLPHAARTWAIPWQWTDEWGLRRFGFHGLGHAYAGERAAVLLERPLGDLRLVTCHIGGGASVTAVAGGSSVDTTMGFTPVDGLVMGTRSGAVDPGVILEAQRRSGLSVDEVERALNRESGLLGLSGVSHDLRDVFAAADDGNARAELAADVYVRSLRAGIAAMATSLGGFDAVVFSGEAGAGNARLRAAAAAGLGFLGLQLDAQRNAETEDTDGIISPDESPVAAVVVVPREDLAIAREVRRLVA